MVRRLVRRDDRDGHVLRLLITRDFRLHRDYDNRDGAGIYVYHDKIVFVNHNRPEPPTTIADLNERIEFPDRVYLNPEVKEMFHALGLIESYGSGIRRAKAALEENGSPALVFGPSNDTDALTKVTMGICAEFAETDAHVKGLARPGYGEANEQINEARQIKVPGRSVGIGSTVRDGQINEQINEQITERQASIVGIISSNPSVTYEEMAAKAGVSKATVRRDVAVLVQKGLVRRVGSRKSGRWEALGT